MRALTTGTLAMTAIAIWSWAKPVPGEVFVTTLNSALSRLALVVGLLLALRLACQPVSSWRSFAAQAAVLGLVALDLLTFAPRQNPALDRTGLEPRLKPMQELHPLPRHGMSRAMISPRADEKLRYEASADPLTDYLCHRLGLFSNLNLLENIPKVNGFYSLYLREAGEVTEALYRSELPVQPAYDFLGVSQLTRPGELFEWTNRPAFLPLVTAGQQPVFVSDEDSLPHFLDPDFDPRRSVLVSVGEQKKLSSRHWESATVAEAHCSAHEIHATVESSGPAMIVFSQAYYQCWQAKVDGQPAHLLRANHGFQAIEVTSSGRHNIILEYKDHGLAIGAVLSGLGLLICAIGWCGQPAIAREETVAS